jgi:hypothetical protein
MHTVAGTVTLFNGLCSRVLKGRGRHIVGLHHGTPAGPQTFQELAERYAGILLQVDSSYDFLGASNGTGNILWLAHTVQTRGGTVKRMVFVDPGPGDEPAMSPSILSVADGAILSLVLRTGEVVTPEIKLHLESLESREEVYLYVADQLAAASSSSLVISIARESESARHLLYAEEQFYHDRELPNFDATGGRRPAALLAICTEQSQKHYSTLDANEQRRLFGPVALELELEGSHLDFVLRCGRGVDRYFNAAVAAFLGLPLKGKPAPSATPSGGLVARGQQQIAVQGAIEPPPPAVSREALRELVMEFTWDDDINNDMPLGQLGMDSLQVTSFFSSLQSAGALGTDDQDVMEVLERSFNQLVEDMPQR